MTTIISIHPENPQQRLLDRAAHLIKEGAVIAYPTDSGYALGCHMGDKQAVERIRRIRQLDEKHHMTLVCKDLSQLALYARVDNTQFRMLKHSIPGPYTFILEATREVPRLLVHPKKREIGIRVPNHKICQQLLETLGEPLMSVSLIMPGDDLVQCDPYEINEMLYNQIDLVLDGGYTAAESTTVVKLTDSIPEVLRVGAGDPSPFQAD